MTSEPTRASCQRRKGKEVWRRGRKDEDEIQLWFVKEVVDTTRFKVRGGGGMCAVEDRDQNNECGAVMMVRYQKIY